MAEFQKSRKTRKILYSKPVIFIMCVVLAFSVASLVSLAKKARETGDNKQAVLNQLSSLKTQSEGLQSDIDKLQTADGVEEKIREKFRVAKAGEGLVVIVDDEGSQSATTTPKLGIFQQFLRDLFQ